MLYVTDILFVDIYIEQEHNQYSHSVLPIFEYVFILF